jgi:hypothetical protein
MSLMAVNENKKEVDEETISKVIELCNWQLRVRRLHNPIDAENVIARMEERIRRQLRANGPMTERQLRQKTNADRDGLWAFSTAMSNLQKADDIYQVSKEERRWGMRASSNS